MGKEEGSQADNSIEGSDDADNDADENEGGRKVYFNIPLPQSARDEEGHPLEQYARNKIRTAKYTPLSFVPKNLWFQFHNIANVYFLFIIILGVRPRLPCPCPALPLTPNFPDFLHLWCLEPSVERSAPHRYPNRNRHQRWRRGLAKNRPR